MRKMSERWVLLWSRLDAQGDPKGVYDDLVRRYSESHRRYHTVRHIAQCLGEFEDARNLAVNPDAIEFAIWFHDAIYDTRAKDNEERSAGIAAEALLKASLPNKLISYVSGLILATRHTIMPTGWDKKLLVDIDLSILGKSSEEFDEYERQIRQEYNWVPDHDFAIGRSELLESFLGRKYIYSTDFFRKRYEADARANMERSLKQLSSRI